MSWVGWEDTVREDCRAIYLAWLRKEWKGFLQGNVALLSTTVLRKEREQQRAQADCQKKEKRDAWKSSSV